MRKYRNGKQSRESRSLSKYSPEYIQYRENRGGYSVKVGLCDISGNGEEDTITHAWRHPALGKLQICQSQVAISAPGVPTNLTSSFVPTIPGVPTNLTSSAIPDIPGVPTNLTSSFTLSAPGVPTNLQSQVGQPPLTNQLATGVNLDMLWVPPGTFTMGSPTTEAGRSSTETEHNVSLTKGFYLGKYEVTQAQYAVVMSGNTNSLNPSPSNWPNNPNRPVEQVSWDDVQIFLSRLNASEQAAGRLPNGWSYVLPTESQWEYACRAGTTTAYSWGDDINATWANYNWDGAHNTRNDFKQTRDVGQYAANPWGFFDMHGNVWEWTADRYDATYPTGNPVIDPSGSASGSARAFRGGDWANTGAGLRSGSRYSGSPGFRGNGIGFRVGFQPSK